MYSRDEVIAATEEYFNGDKLAANVWTDKYCLKKNGYYLEKTPDDMHRRLAKEFARIEQNYANPISEEEIYHLLRNFKYIIPQGSPMAGIGNNNILTSISNCFVIPGAEDSYSGIMFTDQEQIQLMKRRGGVGHDISKLRPQGMLANGSKLQGDTGATLYMERFSNSTREVAQDNRRGALMLSMHVKHPDIERFIDKKMDTTKVTGANVSVKVDDFFMDAILENRQYKQQFPIKGVPQVTQSINAKELWDKIIHNAWKSAEPGVLFWDTILEESPAAGYGEKWAETSTNPCVSEDTLILTDKGQFKIVDKLNQKVNVWNGKKFTEVTPKITGYNQKMVKIIFSDGSELKCTPYHGFYTWEGFSRDGRVVKKEAKDLVVGDKLEKYELPYLFGDVVCEFDKDFYTLGFFAGDGFVVRDSTSHISLYGEKKNLLDKLNVIGNVSENVENDRLTVRVNFPYTDLNIHEMKKYVPKYQDNYMSSMMSWLAGITDSDGSRNSEEGSISISSTDKQFLNDIKLHILNVMGIRGTVTGEKEGGLKEIKGHEYETNKSYRLLISAYNVKKLYDLGLRTYRVKIDDVNPNHDAGRFITIKSIENIEDAEKVYCFTEKERGRGCFNGIITANCGEIPLCPYDSCRLLAINLYSYVNNPFTDYSTFNMELLQEHVIIAQRLMDDIVDLEIEKIDKIINKIKSDPETDALKQVELSLWTNIKNKAIAGRRTGLGVTGEGDMLAALGITYGTPEATNFSVYVHENIAIFAYKSSIIMAKERGAFPDWNVNRDTESKFLARMHNKLLVGEYSNMWESRGRRNIACLTIAPTGSTSILTQTSSGIEPAFSVYYKRRRKTVDETKSTFKDAVGDMWEEFMVFHHKFKTWYDINYSDTKIPIENYTESTLQEIIKLSPYHNATANNIDFIEKVKMQGAIQKWVDHSISVTVNMPKSVTEKDVHDVFLTAWLKGCKGITIYRDDSRSGVLINPEVETNSVIYHEAPKRPKTLLADVYHTTIKKYPWTVLVGLLNNRPYEIFAFPQLTNDNFSLDIKKAEITKVGKKNYKLTGVSPNNQKTFTLPNIIELMSDEEQFQTRDFSRDLRHGVHPKYIVADIDKSSLITSFRRVISRIMKNYLSNDDIKDSCPVCGSSLSFESGCKTCSSCGWTACG